MSDFSAAQRLTRAAALNLLEILALTPADAPRIAAAHKRLAEARHAEDGEAYGAPPELCGCIRCVDALALLEAVERRLAALEALVLATVPAGYVTGAEVERLREEVVRGSTTTTPEHQAR